MSPKIVTGFVTPRDEEEIKTAKEKVLIPSRISAFKSTNGIRPGEFSVIVGQRGNGKSGLCKTIGFEAAVAGVPTLFVLSEEKSAVYKHTFQKAFSSIAKNDPSRFLHRLYFDSMLEWSDSEKNLDFFLEHLEDTINELKTELVIFDNFTTSFIGSMNIATQGSVIDKLRFLASEYDIAIIGVFHTVKGTDIYSKVLDGEDVRGNSTSTNAGSYNYILSTYFRADPVRAVMSIDKARYHPKANKTYWEMIYDHDLDLYTGSKQINYDMIAKMIKDTNDKAKESLSKGGFEWN